MIVQYLQTALESAHYEIIEDEEPYYGEVPGLDGVWSNGRSLEECRKNLSEAIEDWVLYSIARGFPIPVLGGISIRVPDKINR